VRSVLLDYFVTLHNVQVLGVAQERFYGEFVAGNYKMYFGQNAKLCFYRILTKFVSSFSTGFQETPIRQSC
jgi:hypothetical protein